MNTYEITDGDVVISDDKGRLDHSLIHSFLSERSYWAKGRSREMMDGLIEHSLCFGIYQAGRQVGFARLVTDFGTFAWLADVFILEEHRGGGLGKKLMAGVLAHPQLQGLRRFMLRTQDAHKMYAQFGFTPLEHPEGFMEMRPKSGYKCGC